MPAGKGKTELRVNVSAETWQLMEHLVSTRPHATRAELVDAALRQLAEGELPGMQRQLSALEQAIHGLGNARAMNGAMGDVTHRLAQLEQAIQRMPGEVTRLLTRDAPRDWTVIWVAFGIGMLLGMLLLACGRTAAALGWDWLFWLFS